MVWGVGTWICIDSNGQFFHCSVGEGNLSIRGYIETFGGVGTSLCMQSGNFAMYGPNHLLFQLCGRVGTSLCMDPTIQFFNCLVEWVLGYVWTETFSLSIIMQGRGKFDIRGYIQTFSFSMVSGVAIGICMVLNIQLFN